MTRREMTVYRARGNNEDGQNPLIMLQGQWLKRMGFSVGDRICVTCQEGKLIIEQTGSTWRDQIGIVAEEKAEYKGREV